MYKVNKIYIFFIYIFLINLFYFNFFNKFIYNLYYLINSFINIYNAAAAKCWYEIFCF